MESESPISSIKKSSFSSNLPKSGNGIKIGRLKYLSENIITRKKDKIPPKMNAPFFFNESVLLISGIDTVHPTKNFMPVG